VSVDSALRTALFSQKDMKVFSEFFSKLESPLAVIS